MRVRTYRLVPVNKHALPGSFQHRNLIFRHTGVTVKLSKNTASYLASQHRHPCRGEQEDAAVHRHIPDSHLCRCLCDNSNFSNKPECYLEPCTHVCMQLWAVLQLERRNLLVPWGQCSVPILLAGTYTDIPSVSSNLSVRAPS